MILVLLAAYSDPVTLMSNARSRLAPTCEGAACAGPPASARYRVDGSEANIISSKDRAFRDDGTKCNVVGARRCTKRARTIFSTDFSR